MECYHYKTNTPLFLWSQSTVEHLDISVSVICGRYLLVVTTKHTVEVDCAEATERFT